MTLDDLAHHRSTVTRPIHTTYRGHTIYEVPPPTQVTWTYTQHSPCASFLEWPCPALCVTPHAQSRSQCKHLLCLEAWRAYVDAQQTCVLSKMSCERLFQS